MIWIVSKRASNSKKELDARHVFIEKVTQANVSPWLEQVCDANRLFRTPIEFYQCISDKGEYGIVITAHIDEVPELMNSVLKDKGALVIINSCSINSRTRNGCLNIVKAKNTQSELFFAKQEMAASGAYLNYVDNVGTFKFGTTLSERELFIHRKEGLIKAIRMAFDKVVAL